MRLYILFLMLFSGLLLSAAPQAQAAKRAKAGDKASDYKEIPAINWPLASTGFMEVFKLRNKEIESAPPNRYFPGSVAFALGRIDDSGHYLMLKCGSAGNCEGNRDTLEERLVYATLLQVILTPKVTKAQLYNEANWELTPLGQNYIEKLLKRHPDLPRRLARLVAASLASQ